MTIEEWAGVVKLLNATLGGDMVRDQIEAYYRFLKDFLTSAVQSAVAELLSENTYLNKNRYPTVAEIKTLAMKSTKGVLATPEEAFQRARDAVKRYGMDQIEKAHEMCGDTLWAILNMVGGYERLCDCTIDERPTMFAQFRDAWMRNASNEHARQTGQKRTLPFGIPPIGDSKSERISVQKALENLANEVTLPLLESDESSESKQIERPLTIDPTLPVNPSPGTDISRGYYIRTRTRGDDGFWETKTRFVSPEAIAAEEEKRSAWVADNVNRLKQMEST